MICIWIPDIGNVNVGVNCDYEIVARIFVDVVGKPSAKWCQACYAVQLSVPGVW